MKFYIGHLSELIYKVAQLTLNVEHAVACVRGPLHHHAYWASSDIEFTSENIFRAAVNTSLTYCCWHNWILSHKHSSSPPSATVRGVSWLPVQTSSITDGLWPLPATFLIQMLFNFLYPSFTWSSSFPSSTVAAAICFGIRWLCILSTWPYHHSRRDFVHFTIPAPCNMSFISLFVIPQQSSSFTCP